MLLLQTFNTIKVPALTALAAFCPSKKSKTCRLIHSNDQTHSSTESRQKSEMEEIRTNPPLSGSFPESLRKSLSSIKCSRDDICL